MFVFWYCHKRGKEVRLAKEAEGQDGGGSVEEDEIEVSDTADESEVEEMVEELEKVDAANTEVDEATNKTTADVDEKAAILSQPAPAEVALPGEKSEEGEKTAEKQEDAAAAAT